MSSGCEGGAAAAATRRHQQAVGVLRIGSRSLAPGAELDLRSVFSAPYVAATPGGALQGLSLRQTRGRGAGQLEVAGLIADSACEAAQAQTDSDDATVRARQDTCA